MIVILKPFKIATETLSSESLPTSSFILPTHVKLNNILAVSDDDFACIKKMKNEMSQNLSKRMTEQEKEICLLASVLHPKTKQLGFLSPEERDRARNLLHLKGSLLSSDYPHNPQHPIKSEPEDPQSQDLPVQSSIPTDMPPLPSLPSSVLNDHQALSIRACCH